MENIVFLIAIVFIMFMWIKKDIAEICTSMPSEQIATLIITTALVTLFKVAVIAGAILLIKRVVGKIKNR